MTKYIESGFKGQISPPIRVAVVGAGLSGLVAARTFQDYGHCVHVYEKSRGAGGRMATRRTDSYAFDIGAQYFTVRDERFAKMVDSWTQFGIVGRWEGRIRVVREGEFGKEKQKKRRYVGIPGMSALARYLSGNLDIRWRTRVHRISRENQSNILWGECKKALGTYDALIVTSPPEQSVQLIGGLTHLADRAAAVSMSPCWSVMLAFEYSLKLPFEGAFIHDSPLAWAALNSSKPGRGDCECWVLHADSAWTMNHLATDRKVVGHLLCNAFFEATRLTPVEPIFSDAHLWRYARAKNHIEYGSLWDPLTGIGVCGDWCFGSRVEGAFLSGTSIAGKVLGDK